MFVCLCGGEVGLAPPQAKVLTTPQLIDGRKKMVDGASTRGEGGGAERNAIFALKTKVYVSLDLISYSLPHLVSFFENLC